MWTITEYGCTDLRNKFNELSKLGQCECLNKSIHRKKPTHQAGDIWTRMTTWPQQYILPYTRILEIKTEQLKSVLDNFNAVPLRVQYFYLQNCQFHSSSFIRWIHNTWLTRILISGNHMVLSKTERAASFSNKWPDWEKWCC